MHKIEWTNRMILENWGKKELPLFLTCTYNSVAYVDNPKCVLDDTQKYIKRLRRQGHDIRYFMAIERGSKNRRLHNHMILWSKSLQSLPWLVRRDILHHTWKHGAVRVETIRKRGGFGYVAKYITKNLDDLDTLDHVSNYDRKTKKAKKPGRLYTWSNKPALGTPGINRWKKLVLDNHKKMPYTGYRPPLNKLRMFLGGKLITAYIPRDTYLNLCKELEIDLAERYRGKYTW